jgi:1,4-alpha-glucan branching enzyme
VTESQHENRDRRKTGMGNLPYDGGTTFRVWAPFADRVSVIGTFNDWREDANKLNTEENGYWAIDVPEAEHGDEYLFLIQHGDESLKRIDPYARQVTHSNGNAVITTDEFDWDDDTFEMSSWNELIIYEIHIGTFNDPDTEDGQRGCFRTAMEHLPYLKDLGINAIEIMPPMEFSGETSWGYNPALPFAIESEYGGPEALQAFVNAAHQHGIGVIMDVVYNHFGPSDLDLWRFDGWHEGDYGGIYFYNDWRAETPWGKTRPDYGRQEVRDYLRDNALMWLEAYHLDGLRWDSTAYIRHVSGLNGNEAGYLPDGWHIMQRINTEIKAQSPSALSIAEDMKQDPQMTTAVDKDGAGFDTQWDAAFSVKVREVLTQLDDEARELSRIEDALTSRFGEDAFHRVIYTESHDEVANGKARLPEEIWPGNAKSWPSKKRSTLGTVLVFTAPGIPMLFQGQEFLEGRWFDDEVPLDWGLKDEVPGIVQLYRDLLHLRLNSEGVSRGLTGQHLEMLHVDHAAKVLAYHRWMEGGEGDSVVVVLNFRTAYVNDYVLSFPQAGLWRLRFDSHASVYDDDYANPVSADVEAEEDEKGDFTASGLVSLAPYSAVIYSQDAQPEWGIRP